MQALETAIENWHPLWVLLGLGYVAALLALWRMGVAFVNLAYKMADLQAKDLQVKRQLVHALRTLKTAIREALGELED